MRRAVSLVLILLAACTIVIAIASIAAASDAPPGRSFNDDERNVHEPNIEAIAFEGITTGCAKKKYCPSESVTRGQMAAFLNRAFKFPASDVDYFNDDNGTTFEADINAIAKAGITNGCNPPVNDHFCPNTEVSRGQMAAFLNRAFKFPASTADYFVDDNTSIFEADINAIAEAGITTGCGLPNSYCPLDIVARDQMASFLARALGLKWVLAVGPPVCTNDAIHWCYGTGEIQEYSSALERTGPPDQPWVAARSHRLIADSVDLKINELKVRPGTNTTVTKITFTGSGNTSEISPRLWAEYRDRYPIPAWADRIDIEARDAVPADFGMAISIYDLLDGSQELRVDNHEKPIREMKVQLRWSFPGDGFTIGEWFPTRDTYPYPRWMPVSQYDVWDVRAFYPIPESSGDWAGRTQLAEVVDHS